MCQNDAMMSSVVGTIVSQTCSKLKFTGFAPEAIGPESSRCGSIAEVNDAGRTQATQPEADANWVGQTQETSVMCESGNYVLPNARCSSGYYKVFWGGRVRQPQLGS